MSLPARSCWTPADQAALDCLLWELVDGYVAHRDRCVRCAGPLPCPHVGRAIDVVLTWREARLLLTRAEGAPG